MSVGLFVEYILSDRSDCPVLSKCHRAFLFFFFFFIPELFRARPVFVFTCAKGVTYQALSSFDHKYIILRSSDVQKRHWSDGEKERTKEMRQVLGLPKHRVSRRRETVIRIIKNSRSLFVFFCLEMEKVLCSGEIQRHWECKPAKDDRKGKKSKIEEGEGGYRSQSWRGTGAGLRHSLSVRKKIEGIFTLFVIIIFQHNIYLLIYLLKYHKVLLI